MSFFEARGKKEDRELELEFRRICDTGRLKLPFEIVIANKQINSCGLQLADLVARPIGRRYLAPEQPNRTYDTLESKFVKNDDGQEIGFGLKVLP